MKVSNKSNALTNFKPNKINPFIVPTIEKVGECIVTKNSYGKGSDRKMFLSVVDSDGEPQGHAIFQSQKVVEDEQFVKIYTNGLAQFAELKPSVMKVFEYISKQTKPNSDKIVLIADDVIEYTNLSIASIYRALGTLCERKIIARGRFYNEFFINPQCFFNGSRVTLVQSFIKANAPEYKVTDKTLKSTIKIMKQDGTLRKIENSQLELPFE